MPATLEAEVQQGRANLGRKKETASIPAQPKMARPPEYPGKVTGIEGSQADLGIREEYADIRMLIHPISLRIQERTRQLKKYSSHIFEGFSADNLNDICIRALKASGYEPKESSSSDALELFGHACLHTAEAERDIYAVIKDIHLAFGKS